MCGDLAEQQLTVANTLCDKQRSIDSSNCQLRTVRIQSRLPGLCASRSFPASASALSRAPSRFSDRRCRPDNDGFRAGCGQSSTRARRRAFLAFVAGRTNLADGSVAESHHAEVSVAVLSISSLSLAQAHQDPIFQLRQILTLGISWRSEHHQTLLD